MNYLMLLESIVSWIFIFSLSFYLITNLQWYNYSLYRVFTKHHKWTWHISFFFLPLALFMGVVISKSIIALGIFCALLILLYVPFLILWYLKLDKKLNFTQRVTRFFIILTLFLILHQTLFIFFNHSWFFFCSFILTLPFSILSSNLYEWILFNRFYKLAKLKLGKLKQLQIIAITGSFGKTSIKNFLNQILSSKYNVYATPRSINTIKGIVSDINSNLKEDIEIYIAEAGARQKGDIAEIATLLNHQYAVIGEIGEQHLEYFKNTQNILETKFELLKSKRLKKAFFYKENTLPQDLAQESRNLLSTYPKNIKNIQSTLENTSFELEIKGIYHKFETTILGTFNISNLSAAIMLAYELGVKIESIQKVVATMQPIPHRLQKIIAGGKIILDDSFNGNLKGMLEAIRLSSLHNGRKVIITPGLVESNNERNIQLAKTIDSVFDLVIITGDLNSKILSQYINKPQKIVLKDKSQLENILLTSTYKGDLLLFANDAPNFI
ncbi:MULTISPECIES: Mur ligase family protein [unclassified Helicobacter]|uniref:Mur ligase family protein n=1 Tax=unclassified Helicobacter TaxID=2593540 RepID=UPI000CF0D2E2|nr:MULTISPECIES: UDP-N-acetylmuramoyl-tripeptide--D-alanyl-D-alanine ligase [unclassified Helicobacter]